MTKLKTTAFGVALAAVAFTFAPAVSGFSQAEAKKCVGVNCKKPKAVKRGQAVPFWTVARCVIRQGGRYKTIRCNSPRAVHRSPTGNMAVCFIGTDRKVHWDYQREVRVGRRFINLHIGNNQWVVDWR